MSPQIISLLIDSYRMGYGKVGLVEGDGSLGTFEGYILSPPHIPTFWLRGSEQLSSVIPLRYDVSGLLYRSRCSAASHGLSMSKNELLLSDSVGCFVIAIRMWQDTEATLYQTGVPRPFSWSLCCYVMDVQLTSVQVTWEWYRHGG